MGVRSSVLTFYVDKELTQIADNSNLENFYSIDPHTLIRFKIMEVSVV